MYYSAGNYEAFARPRKARGVDDKSAYIVGAGLAGLATAAFLVRDAQMDGRRITIFEASKLPGGATDGIKHREKGYLIRGDRELEDHMECMWDLWRSIPSIEVEGASVLDEYYWLNKEEPNYTLRRATQHRGEPIPMADKLTLSSHARREMVKLFFTPDEELYDKRVSDVVGQDFLDSNFWLFFKTMFAMVPWHSALELKRYLNRFIHLFSGMWDLAGITFSRYNQYESFILPLVKWLEEQHGVTIVYDTRVTNVLFDITAQRKVARRIEWLTLPRDKDLYDKQASDTEWRTFGQPGAADLTENDLVFITNGSPVENYSWGDHHTPAEFDPQIHEVSIWALWRNIAKQDPAFGRPDKFCTHTDQSTQMTATVTFGPGKVADYIQKLTQRDPFAFGGSVFTGGNLTFRDSAWSISWNGERQPHFKTQRPDEVVSWIIGLFPDQPGNFVHKPMLACTGEEITQEWLYHMGVPVQEIGDLANTVISNPCILPFVVAFFLPRAGGDRPAVVPERAVNFAFIGQFAETARDCIYTVEYSVRTGMEAVYTLLDVQRGVPEVWGSQYDIRALINSAVVLRDGEALELPEPFMKLLDRTDIGDLLRQWGSLPGGDPARTTPEGRAVAEREVGTLL